MADFITNQLLTDNYADCQLGPFGQVKSFQYSVFQVAGDLGGVAAMQCAIGRYPRSVFWEDVDRPRYPMIGARLSNVFGVRFRKFPGNTHAVRVSIELDTHIDPEIQDTGIPSGTMDAGGAFTPFSGGGGTAGRRLVMLWESLAFPFGLGPYGGVWRVPYIGGVSVNFTLDRSMLRAETPGAAGTYTIQLQSSPGGGVFIPSLLDTLSLATGVREADGTPSAVLTSGQLVRVNFTSVGLGAQVLTVQLEGSS